MNIGWLQKLKKNSNDALFFKLLPLPHYRYIYIYSTAMLGEQITCIDDNDDIDGI